MTNLDKITKAVFPVAGLGTRFMPATKAHPKEMIPILDKPLIQYAVEEAIEAGITQLIFITSNSKRPIEDHFDNNFELEQRLEKSKKFDLLNEIRNIIPEDVSCIYIRQKEPLGLGHAVQCAKSVIGNEPFAVLLADDLFMGTSKNTLKNMISHTQSTGAASIAVEKIIDTTQYGIVDCTPAKNTFKPVSKIIEKPNAENAPSNFGVIGRYVLPPSIFSILENTLAGSGGEIQLTDDIATLLEKEAMDAYHIEGVRYDCGSKLGFLKATIASAMSNKQLKAPLLEHLNEIISSENKNKIEKTSIPELSES